MIAGRLHWRPTGAKLAGRQESRCLRLPSWLAGAHGSRNQAPSIAASLRGRGGHAFHRSREGSTCSQAISKPFATRSRSRIEPSNGLSPTRAFSAASATPTRDEILHAAQLSPVALTHKLEPEEWERLYAATRSNLKLWIKRLGDEAKIAFPEKVTAFRKDMAVHGRYGQPCPRCGEPIQRIRFADNETNYCVRCQTGGKLLADRSLSRLLRSDWPKTLDEMETLKRR